jgi:hypothetical protein
MNPINRYADWVPPGRPAGSAHSRCEGAGQTDESRCRADHVHCFPPVAVGRPVRRRVAWSPGHHPGVDRQFPPRGEQERRQRAEETGDRAPPGRGVRPVGGDQHGEVGDHRGGQQKPHDRPQVADRGLLDGDVGPAVEAALRRGQAGDGPDEHAARQDRRRDRRELCAARLSGHSWRPRGSSFARASHHALLFPGSAGVRLGPALGGSTRSAAAVPPG